MAGERRIGGGTRLAGVIGWPVEHSRSPQMHNAAYATLGIDATLLYEYGSWTHQLTDSELAANTPYNTRVRHGLPPTPICNPGLKSLEAAAHPAHVDYLYYVAKPDGSHYFTNNYQDFLNHGG